MGALKKSLPSLNVMDFGAKGDGNNPDTKAIQDAVDKAAKDGGARVLLPAGKYLSGTIRLKSNIDLHLAKGATLLGSTSRMDYFKLPPPAADIDVMEYQFPALLLAGGEKNISISGEGVIDGRGAALAEDVKRQAALGKVPNAHETERPTLVQFVRCVNSRISGVRMKDASCWVQNYLDCDGLEIDGISVESVAFWNNDGIDVTGCRRVRIANCKINSADDGICLKSSNSACEDVLIENCTVRSSASAFKCGTASSQGFRNVTMRNIKVYDTARSGIALEIVDGGLMENIDIRGMEMTNVGNAFFIKLGDRARETRPVPGVGAIRNVRIADIVADVTGEDSDAAYNHRCPRIKEPHNLIPASISGFPGHPVGDVSLENIEVIYAGGGKKEIADRPLGDLSKVPEREKGYPEYDQFGELPAWALFCRHVEDLKMRNVKFRLRAKDSRAAMVFSDVGSLKMADFEINSRESGTPALHLAGVKKADISGLVAK